MQPSESTFGEIRKAGYQHKTIRDELRSNLVRMLRSGETAFPGLHGYRDSVIPQVENAILAGHDILLLGERGQAKSRLARSLTSLLDEWIPAIAGADTNDDPFEPVSASARAILAEKGDDTLIEWVHRSRRFAEKLATPDTSIADLIGEVDPIKIAEGRYLSNEEVISYGLIPRANRGIFNLNELPDLSERIQVGLLNILEERDVQIRGFTVRMPLDIVIVASANPEDYTNRGRIITPLKDRFGSQVRTHYPRTIEHELRIVDQEQETSEIEGVRVFVPGFTRQMIAAISQSARVHPKVNARSGVSVRMTIANYEAMVANAQRRAILSGQKIAVPGIHDIPALAPSMMGKIEFDTWEADDDRRAVEDIISQAVRSVSASISDAEWVNHLSNNLSDGTVYLLNPREPAENELPQFQLSDSNISEIQSFADSTEPAVVLAAVHFALEYLHRSGQIGKNAAGYTAV